MVQRSALVLVVMVLVTLSLTGCRSSPSSSSDARIEVFTATPTSVAAGDPVTLRWRARDASTCHLESTADGAAPAGPQPVACDGSAVMTPASSTTYRFSALRRDGVSYVWRDVTVEVEAGEPPPAGGVLLDGPPDTPALEAVGDHSSPLDVTPDVVSTDDEGRSVVRTLVSVAFAEDATVADVNAVLEAVDGEIVDMVPDRLVVLVRVPDPGSLVSLERLVTELEADERVRYVLPGYVGTVSALPPPFVAPDPGFPMTDLKNQLAVGGHALWNATGALSSGTRPLVIVADVFGEGPFDEAFAVELLGDPPVAGRPGPDNVVQRWGHGYKVVSVIAAQYDRVAGIDTARNRPVGMYPLTTRLEVVDWQAFGETGAYGIDVVPLAVVSNEVIRRVRAAVARGERNVIVNTSIGEPASSVDTKAALAWIELVRGTSGRFTVGAGLEGAFLHVSAAGTFALVTEAERASPYNAAALTAGLRDGPVWNRRDVPNLTNTLVVEAAEVLAPAPPPVSRERYELGCMHPTSSHGGHMSAGGDRVTVLDAPARGNEIEPGSSYAAPQVAAVAQWVWTIAPQLSVEEVIALVRETALPTRSSCSGSARAPAAGLQAFEALLALDGRVPGAPVRLALLDVNGDGRFDEADIAVFVSEWQARDGAQDHSRFDLNGDTFSGGERQQRFDLTMDGRYDHVQITVEALVDGRLETVTVGLHEANVSDLEVLCFYAFDDATGLYTGDPEARRDLLGTACAFGALDEELGDVSLEMGLGTYHYASAAPLGTAVRVYWSFDRPIPEGGVTVVLSGPPGWNDDQPLIWQGLLSEYPDQTGRYWSWRITTVPAVAGTYSYSADIGGHLVTGDASLLDATTSLDRPRGITTDVAIGVGGPGSGDHLTVSWSRVPGAAQYRVRLCEMVDDACVELDQAYVSGTTVTFTDLELRPSTPYRVYILAFQHRISTRDGMPAQTNVSGSSRSFTLDEATTGATTSATAGATTSATADPHDHGPAAPHDGGPDQP